jgi:hypothetical protein
MLLLIYSITTSSETAITQRTRICEIWMSTKNRKIMKISIIPPPFPFPSRWTEVFQLQNEFQERFWSACPLSAPLSLPQTITSTISANESETISVEGSPEYPAENENMDEKEEEILEMNEYWTSRFAAALNKRKKRQLEQRQQNHHEEHQDWKRSKKLQKIMIKKKLKKKNQNKKNNELIITFSEKNDIHHNENITTL